MSEVVIKQEFHVHFSYPVHFTNGLFQPHNSLFADVLAQDGGVGPRKVFFVLDAAVVANPNRGLLRGSPRATAA
jgi:3-dehydroquinate synthase